MVGRDYVADEKDLKVDDLTVSSAKEEEGNFKPEVYHILPISGETI